MLAAQQALMKTQQKGKGSQNLNRYQMYINVKMLKASKALNNCNNHPNISEE